MNQTQAVNAVLNKMRSGLGTGEYPPGSDNNFIVQWYNRFVDKIGRGPWCQMTVTWAFWTSLPKQIVKGRAYTVWAAQDFQKRFLGGTWHWGTAGIQPGDIVFYDWAGAKGNVAYVDHVGIVEKVYSTNSFYVLEGNQGSGVLSRNHRDSKYVVGYGRPDWSLVMNAADLPTEPAHVQTKIPGTDDLLLVLDGFLGNKTKVAACHVMGLSHWTDVVQRMQWKFNKLGLRDSQGRTLKLDGVGIGSNETGRYPRTGSTNTLWAAQRWLGTHQDGYLSSPSDWVIKFQRKINTGRMF